MQLLSSEQQVFKEGHKNHRLFSSTLVCSLGLFVFGGGKKMIILIFFRWLSSLWLSLVIADVKWHPIAFKMGFKATLPSRQLGGHTSLNKGKAPVRRLANSELMSCLICCFFSVKAVSAPACHDHIKGWTWGVPPPAEAHFSGFYLKNNNQL